MTHHEHDPAAHGHHAPHDAEERQAQREPASDHESAAEAGGGALEGDDFTAGMHASETEADEASGATGGGRVRGE